MTLPMFPPSIQDLVRGLDSAELSRLLMSSTPLPTGKYLHWDQLRHRTPPDGLSSEQWWLSVCLARSGGMQALQTKSHPPRRAAYTFTALRPSFRRGKTNPMA